MKKAFIKKSFIYVSIALIVFSIYILIEPYWIQIKTYPISSQEIPENFSGTKIAFLTDIHHGPFFNLDRVKSIVKTVNAQNPDIIILGGDYVHRNVTYTEPVFSELANLKAPLGIYGVLGNHDHWEGSARAKKSMQNAGINLIDNKAFWVKKGNDRIKIGGVGDFYGDKQDIKPTINDVSSKDFVILTSHSPDYAEKLKPEASKLIDIILSGHTHGGQITFFGLWAPLIPSNYGQKYRTGMIEKGNIKVIVSNGIGTVTPPVRFFARPQIVIVELNNNKTN